MLSVETLDTLTKLSQTGVAVVALIAAIVLWRHLIAMQTRYEVVLERCITALVRVNDYLEEHDSGKKHQQ